MVSTWSLEGWVGADQVQKMGEVPLLEGMTSKALTLETTSGEVQSCFLENQSRWVFEVGELEGDIEK